MKQDSQQTIDDPLNTHTEWKNRRGGQIEGGHMLNLYHIPHYGKDKFIITYGEKTSSQWEMYLFVKIALA